MTITECQAIAQAHLAAKVSLRGVTFVSIDSHEIQNEVNQAIAKLGACGLLGTTDGTNPAPNHRAPNFTTTLSVQILENVVLNRGRSLAATVADQAARLALSGVAAGQKVLQSDTGKYWWLLAADASDAASWAPLLTATQILELVIRSLHFFSPDSSTTFVSTGYSSRPENEQEGEFIAAFQVRTYLDPTEPD